MITKQIPTALKHHGPVLVTGGGISIPIEVKEPKQSRGGRASLTVQTCVSLRFGKGETAVEGWLRHVRSVHNTAVSAPTLTRKGIAGRRT